MIMLTQLVSIISVFIKVYCHNDVSMAESLPFSHEDLIIPAEEYTEHIRDRTMEEKGDEKQMNHEAMVVSRLADKSEYCSSFRTCFECVKSVWYPCDWCHNVGCTNIGEILCPYAMTLKSSNQNILKACPYIQHQGPILLPSGLRSHITVKLHAPDPILNDMDIICQIKMKNRLTHLKGLIIKQSVYCYPVQLNAEEFRQTVFGSFRVLWGGYEPYSNEVPLTVYNCGSLADECDECRLIAPEFGCGWCDDLNSCVTANKCEDMMNWSLNRLTCKYIKKKMFFV